MMHNNDDDNVKHYNTKGNNNNDPSYNLCWYIMCFNFTPFNCLSKYKSSVSSLLFTENNINIIIIIRKNFMCKFIYLGIYGVDNDTF